MFRPLSLEERVRTFWSPLLDAPGSSGVTCWFTFLPAAWRQHLYRTAGEWGGGRGQLPGFPPSFVFD